MKKIIAKLFVGNIVQKVYIDAPFDKVVETLEKVVLKYEFGIQAVHDLKETYKNKKLSLPEDFEYKIVQICNAPKSHKALQNMSFDMGVMMPKSIIIAYENGKTSMRFMKLKPWMVSLMFPELDVAPLSKHITEVMNNIVNDTITDVRK